MLVDLKTLLRFRGRGCDRDHDYVVVFPVGFPFELHQQVSPYCYPARYPTLRLKKSPKRIRR